MAKAGRPVGSLEYIDEIGDQIVTRMTKALPTAHAMLPEFGFGHS